MPVYKFSKFPSLQYGDKQIIDITRRVALLNKVSDNASVLYKYSLRDDERPEDVARRVYDDENLYYIILVINNIVNVNTQWLMNENDLLSYVSRKYGEGNENEIHHHETTEDSELGAGVWVNQTELFTTPISNYEYEFQLNEEKRDIKLLRTRYVREFINQYQSIVSTGRGS